MQLTKLHKRFDVLQTKFGAKGLSSIYGAGETHLPKVCFVFMNPTARNVSAWANWTGFRAPWLGTKNTWKLFSAIGILPKKLNLEIQSKKSKDWNAEFSGEVYREIKKSGCFVTNLAKCTQNDAIYLKDSVFKEYRELMLEEIELLNPKIIISFGNQVSSVLLGKSINVSKYRKKSQDLTINGKTFKTFPVFYPVGQGMRNMPKAIEDIKFVLSEIL